VVVVSGQGVDDSSGTSGVELGGGTTMVVLDSGQGVDDDSGTSGMELGGGTTMVE
jgi:hypothetical protein